MRESVRLTGCVVGISSQGMATKTIQVSLPSELTGYVQRKVKDGRYESASEVVRDALRRMEATEVADESRDFERAFAGGHDRPETEQEIQRVEKAVRAGRKA